MAKFLFIIKCLISVITISIGFWMLYVTIKDLVTRWYPNLSAEEFGLTTVTMIAAFLIYKKPFIAGILLIVEALIFIAGFYTLIFPGMPLLILGLIAVAIGKLDFLKSCFTGEW